VSPPEWLSAHVGHPLRRARRPLAPPSRLRQRGTARGIALPPRSVGRAARKHRADHFTRLPRRALGEGERSVRRRRLAPPLYGRNHRIALAGRRGVRRGAPPGDRRRPSRGGSAATPRAPRRRPRLPPPPPPR